MVAGPDLHLLHPDLPLCQGRAPHSKHSTGHSRDTARHTGDPTPPHIGGVWISLSSLKDNGMFSSGLSVHVLICMNPSSGSTEIIFMRNKGKLAAQHYQTTWYLGQSQSSSSAQGMVCTLKSEVFYQTHTGHLCQYLIVFFHVTWTLITKNIIWHNRNSAHSSSAQGRVCK